MKVHQWTFYKSVGFTNWSWKLFQGLFNFLLQSTTEPVYNIAYKNVDVLVQLNYLLFFQDFGALNSTAVIIVIRYTHALFQICFTTRVYCWESVMCVVSYTFRILIRSVSSLNAKSSSLWKHIFIHSTTLIICATTHFVWVVVLILECLNVTVQTTTNAFLKYQCQK